MSLFRLKYFIQFLLWWYQQHNSDEIHGTSVKRYGSGDVTQIKVAQLESATHCYKSQEHVFNIHVIKVQNYYLMSICQSSCLLSG